MATITLSISMPGQTWDALDQRAARSGMSRSRQCAVDLERLWVMEQEREYWQAREGNRDED